MSSATDIVEDINTALEACIHIFREQGNRSLTALLSGSPVVDLHERLLHGTGLRLVGGGEKALLAVQYLVRQCIIPKAVELLEGLLAAWEQGAPPSAAPTTAAAATATTATNTTTAAAAATAAAASQDYDARPHGDVLCLAGACMLVLSWGAHLLPEPHADRPLEGDAAVLAEQLTDPKTLTAQAAALRLVAKLSSQGLLTSRCGHLDSSCTSSGGDGSGGDGASSGNSSGGGGGGREWMLMGNRRISRFASTAVNAANFLSQAAGSIPTAYTCMLASLELRGATTPAAARAELLRSLRSSGLVDALCGAALGLEEVCPGDLSSDHVDLLAGAEGHICQFLDRLHALCLEAEVPAEAALIFLQPEVMRFTLAAMEQLAACASMCHHPCLAGSSVPDLVPGFRAWAIVQSCPAAQHGYPEAGLQRAQALLQPVPHCLSTCFENMQEGGGGVLPPPSVVLPLLASSCRAVALALEAATGAAVAGGAKVEAALGGVHVAMLDDACQLAGGLLRCYKAEEEGGLAAAAAAQGQLPSALGAICW